MAFAVLAGCDNFQEFMIENPCDFDVTVEWRYDETYPWSTPATVPSNGEREDGTGAGAGVDSMEVRVSAESRQSIVRRVQAPDDPQVWRVPESFCRT